MSFDCACFIWVVLLCRPQPPRSAPHHAACHPGGPRRDLEGTAARGIGAPGLRPRFDQFVQLRTAGGLPRPVTVPGPSCRRRIAGFCASVPAGPATPRLDDTPVCGLSGALGILDAGTRTAAECRIPTTQQRRSSVQRAGAGTRLRPVWKSRSRRRSHDAPGAAVRRRARPRW